MYFISKHSKKYYKNILERFGNVAYKLNFKISLKDILSQIQLKKFKTINYVVKSAAFYKQLLAQHKSKAKINQCWNKIPVTTKRDLHNNSNDFLCVPFSEIVEIASTSGTTGQPMFMYYTKNDLDRLAFNEYWALKMAGICADDIVQIMTTLDKRFIAGIAYYKGLNLIGAKVIRVGVDALSMQWETILKCKPTYIITVPSFILKLIDYAIENNIDLAKVSIKKAICIGESIYNEDLKPNNLHKKICKFWDIELFSTYASTETVTSFAECKFHNGLHANPFLIWPEVLDENDLVLPPNTVGELVITTFETEAMPLIRFKTGDMVYYTESPCACGHKFRSISPVLGRKNLLLKLKGTSLYPESILNVIHNHLVIKHFAIIINKSKWQQDHIILYINSISKKEMINFKNDLKEQLRVTIVIKTASLQKLNELLTINKSRKISRIIDLR